MALEGRDRKRITRARSLIAAQPHVPASYRTEQARSSIPILENGENLGWMSMFRRIAWHETFDHVISVLINQ